MKNLPAILSSVILAPAMWSCADDFSDKKFEVAAPEDIAEGICQPFGCTRLFQAWYLYQ